MRVLRAAVEGPAEHPPKVLTARPNAALVGRLSAHMVLIALHVAQPSMLVAAPPAPVLAAEEEGVAEVGVHRADGGQDGAQIRHGQGGDLVGGRVCQFRGVLGVDRESGQHRYLGRWRDAAWFVGLRVGGRDAVAEQAVQQVQGGNVFCMLFSMYGHNETRKSRAKLTILLLQVDLAAQLELARKAKRIAIDSLGMA